MQFGSKREYCWLRLQFQFIFNSLCNAPLWIFIQNIRLLHRFPVPFQIWISVCSIRKIKIRNSFSYFGNDRFRVVFLRLYICFCSFFHCRCYTFRVQIAFCRFEGFSFYQFSFFQLSWRRTKYSFNNRKTFFWHFGFWAVARVSDCIRYEMLGTKIHAMNRFRP